MVSLMEYIDRSRRSRVPIADARATRDLAVKILRISRTTRSYGRFRGRKSAMPHQQKMVEQNPYNIRQCKLQPFQKGFRHSPITRGDAAASVKPIILNILTFLRVHLTLFVLIMPSAFAFRQCYQPGIAWAARLFLIDLNSFLLQWPHIPLFSLKFGHSVTPLSHCRPQKIPSHEDVASTSDLFAESGALLGSGGSGRRSAARQDPSAADGRQEAADKARQQMVDGGAVGRGGKDETAPPSAGGAGRCVARNRHRRSQPHCGFYYSAPASPMHFMLSTTSLISSASVHPEASAAAAAANSSFEFDFSFRLAGEGDACAGSMSSADELFFNCQIRPMKLSTHLQRPQVLAPLLDLDESEEADMDRSEEQACRGRDLKFRDRSLRRRTRSMSPLRTASF
nr:uncharacterized protein LOC109180908 [Ipomoea batatas]